LDQRKLFGTNGVRGVVNRELTAEHMLKLAMATGTYFKAAEVAVGCDARLSSPLFLEAVCSGLTSVGCQVWNLGLITTPALQFLTKDWRFKGSIMVTASHNPPEYNGLKVMGNHGVELPHEDESRIEAIYFKASWKLADWRTLKPQLSVSEKFERYFQSVIDSLDVKGTARRFRVLVDAANGVAALSTPRIIEKLGGEVILVNGTLDGTFPGRLPEPTPNNLAKTSKKLPSLHADFGVAHDGDGDRAVFLDEHGSVRWGDHTFALIVRDFLENHPGEKIVTPISSSIIIEEIARKYGSEIVYTPVGSVYVSNLMLKIHAKLGGEENGGIFYAPHVAARDGGITTAWIYTILAKERRPLSKLVQELPKTHIIKDRMRCPDAVKEEVTERLRELPAKGEISTVDGIKVTIPPRSWILVRPSGTEPIFRIMAEAPTKSKAQRIVADYKIKLSRIIKSCMKHAS